MDPIALSAKIVEADDCCECKCREKSCDPSAIITRISLTSRMSVPGNICDCFDDELIIDDDARQVLVTLGLFTIVKIERSVQLLIKAVDFCIPEKECCAAEESNPCDLFNSIRFPIDEFFPPSNTDDMRIGNCGLNAARCGCDCK